MNGDSHPDLLVLFINMSDSSLHARVFYGAPTMDAVPDAQLPLPQPPAGWIALGAGIGDINGDGIGDLAISTPNELTDSSQAGMVYVYSGGASLGASPDPILQEDQAGDRFGTSVVSAQVAIYGHSNDYATPVRILRSFKPNDDFGIAMSQ